jgi:hypothetical protein
VFVFNLPLNVDEAALVQMFSRFGQIVSTRVCKDITTRQSKVIALTCVAFELRIVF